MPSLIQRRILARLAVMRDAVVLVDELIEIVWAGQPPRTAMAALQNQIARLRSVLGRDAIATVASGYRLDAPTDIDALRAALTAAEASLRAGQHDAAEARATEGLALWRGRPVPELDHWTGVEGVRPRPLETDRALSRTSDWPLRSRACDSAGPSPRPSVSSPTTPMTSAAGRCSSTPSHTPGDAAMRSPPSNADVATSRTASGCSRAPTCVPHTRPLVADERTQPYSRTATHGTGTCLSAIRN